MSDDVCSCHSGMKTKVESLEKQSDQQWKKIGNLDTKLNLILGGVLLSPFIVAALTLLIRAKG